MLQCVMQIAAMQTNSLYLAYGIRKCSSDNESSIAFSIQKSVTMSKTASIALAPSSSLFGRLFATIDRLLLSYAEMTIRNGDVPRSGI
jgi:hypothetical protein